jgi:hypothetical protein
LLKKIKTNKTGVIKKIRKNRIIRKMNV